MMFARWLFVRLNAAEKALHQGRIDDACAAALEADLREHPRGQKLADGLVKPLLARARLHRQAGRFAAALADLDKLVTLGRAGPEVTGFRERVAAEMRQDAREEAEQRAAYAQAADQLRAGHLETGRLEIGRVEDTRQREQLAHELDQRLQRGGELLQQAAEALDHDDVVAAVRLWREACERHGRTREAENLVGRLTKACREAIAGWHDEGRIGHLLSASSGIDLLLPFDPTLAECARLIALGSRAVTQLAAADYTGLRQTMLQLKAARGDVQWVNAALAALARLAEGQELLMASPLGLYASMAGLPSAQTKPHVETNLPAAQPYRLDASSATPADPNAVRLDRPLLVLVDGGGSSLLISRDLVRLGGSGGVEADVAIPAELQSHHADIVRRGEDYFLTAYGPAEVNHRRIEHTLLRDGDHVVLGNGVKLVFNKPSVRSESAVLRLSHRCRLPLDVSDVILFRDTCLIGPGSTCHVRTREDFGQVVLFERGGALHVRQTAGKHYLTAPVRAVVAGQTLDLGDLRLTVEPYPDGPTHGG